MNQNETPHQAQTDRKDINNDKFLIFKLSEEQFAIPLAMVREVIGYKAPTPIPLAPSHHKGILSLRDQIIPIVELRSKMKMSATKITPETSIIIIDFEGNNCGVIVDSILSVNSITVDNIAPAPEVHNQLNYKLIGIYKENDKMTLILDITSLFNINDLKVSREKNTLAA